MWVDKYGTGSRSDRVQLGFKSTSDAQLDAHYRPRRRRSREMWVDKYGTGNSRGCVKTRLYTEGVE
jgi:hypothetical protein